MPRTDPDRAAAIRAVIFDMDGVLVDSEPLHLKAMRAVLEAEGHTLDTAEYVQYIGDSARNTWETIRGRRGLSGSLEDYLARYDDAVCAVIAAEAVPMPGLLPLLDLLRADGVPLAVGSTSPQRWVTVTLAALGVADSFQAVAGRDMVAHGKPAPDVFLRAADLLGVPPTACLVVEDSPRGLQAARAAGAFVVAFRPGGQSLQAPGEAGPADLVVDSLPALGAWWRRHFPHAS